MKCFNYKKVVLGYGPDFAYHVNVGFSAKDRQFVVTFGSRGGAGFNGHVLLTQFYLALFNSSKSLPLLAKTLVLSSAPLQALVKLSQVRRNDPDDVMDNFSFRDVFIIALSVMPLEDNADEFHHPLCLI